MTHGICSKNKIILLLAPNKNSVEKHSRYENPVFITPFSAKESPLLKQEKYDNAQHSYERALAIYEKTPSEPFYRMDVWHNLALLYDEQRRYVKAEEAFQQALHSLRLAEKGQTAIEPRLIEVLEDYAEMPRKVGRIEEAKQPE